MKTFNLKNNLLEKTAMGYTHRRNRSELAWWTYEELISNPPENWKKFVEKDPSMESVVLRESGIERDKRIKGIIALYGVDYSTAAQLEKTYIGYHPSYGGYACYVGPYLSKGERHGPQHIRSKAIDTFNFHMFRKGQLGEEDFYNALYNNIKEYQEQYGIRFEPKDFNLIINIPKSEEEAKGKSKYNALVYNAELDAQKIKETLKPSQSQTGDLNAATGPFIGKGSRTSLNNYGYIKILTSEMGSGLSNWSQDVIKKISEERGYTIEELIEKMGNDRPLLKQIYDETYKKWKIAYDKGEAAAIGMPQPPQFSDSSLSRLHRSQTPQETKPQEKNIAQLKLKKEIASLMPRNLTSEEMAEELNNNPKRLETEHLKELKRKRCEKAGVPIDQSYKSSKISPEEAQKYMDEIIKEKNKLGFEKFYHMSFHFSDQIEKLETSYGFDNMEDAIKAAAMENSMLPVDSVTKAPIGQSTLRIFDIPSNFTNFTSEDLISFKDKKYKIESGMNEIERKLKKIQEQKALDELKETEEQQAETEELKLDEMDQIKLETFEPESEEIKSEIKPEEVIPEATIPEPVTEPAKVETPVNIADDFPIDDLGQMKEEQAPPVAQQTIKPSPKKPKTKQIPEKKAPKTEKKKTKKDDVKVEIDEKELDPIATTIKNLIKIASELDAENKCDEAEEVHKIIRKYI